MMVTRGGGEWGNEGVLVEENKISVMQDKRVLEVFCTA